ncbi:MAG: HAD hydrolase-like protein [Bdellovibrionota bacterium]
MSLIDELKGKKHIIWDWNGTILDDVQHAVNTINLLLKENQRPPLGMDRYKKIFCFPIKNYYDELGFDYTRKSFEDLCHEFVDSFMEGVFTCRPYPEVEKILLELANEGRDQSVLSATDQKNLDKMIGYYNFDHIFNFVFGIDNKFGASKLSRGQELINQLQYDLTETVLIGDTLHDLEVGRYLGIDVVLLNHGHQCQTVLIDKHDKVISV